MNKTQTVEERLKKMHDIVYKYILSFVKEPINQIGIDYTNFDKQLNKTIQSEIKANNFKWKKKIRGLKIDTNNDFAISEEYHLGCTDTVKEFNKTINNLIKNE